MVQASSFHELFRATFNMIMALALEQVSEPKPKMEMRSFAYCYRALYNSARGDTFGGRATILRTAPHSIPISQGRTTSGPMKDPATRYWFCGH